ncbi:hypothetical protein P3D61_29400, partial [Pseudomonas aeruginosa]
GPLFSAPRSQFVPKSFTPESGSNENINENRRLYGGGGEIRTHGRVSPSTVFKSIAEFKVYAGCGWISFPQFRHFSFDGCRLLPGSILKLRK